MKALILLMIFTTAAHAYPIFYKCSAKGELSETFSGSEEAVLATQMSSANSASLEDCLSQLKQVLFLNSDTLKTSNALFKAAKNKIQKIDTGTFKNLSKDHRLVKQLRMCQQVQKVFENEGSVTLYYPHQTTYQYITGYRKDNKSAYKLFRKPLSSSVKTIINEAVSIGVDPLAVLGMAMMERGGGGIDAYFKNMHDKRSQEVLGCMPGVFAPDGKPQIGRNAKRFNEIASHLNLGNKQEKYFVCVGQANDAHVINDTNGFRGHYDLAEAKLAEKTCCVETVYPMDNNEGGRRAATYLYFDQLQNKSYVIPQARNYQDSIEHRLNTFLGMSKTVGTYPSYRISPHRVGVNSYEDPNYGRQIMDYMLNSFMRSGEVMSYISEAEKVHNKKRKSLLCYSQPAGNYIIDSDFYFNKIKATKRMGPIKALFDAGKSWNQIGIAYQSVLLQEFTYYQEQINEESAVYKKFKKYFTPEEMRAFDQTAKQLYDYRNSSVRRKSDKVPALTAEQNKFMSRFYKLYFTKREFYEYRKSLVNAAKEDTKLSWSRSTDKNMAEIKEQTAY